MNLSDKVSSLKGEVSVLHLKTGEDLIGWVSPLQHFGGDDAPSFVFEEPHSVVVTGQGIIFVKWCPAADLKDNPLIVRRNVRFPLADVLTVSKAYPEAVKVFMEQFNKIATPSKSLITPGHPQLVRGSDD